MTTGKKEMSVWGAGLFFLIADLRINTPITYPNYVMLEGYGTETQKLVMSQVVGSYLKVDVISDVIGFLLLLLACVWMIRMNKRFVIASIFSVAGLLLYMFRMFMPWVLDGATLYGGEYAIHFLIAAAESIALFFAVAGVVYYIETIDVHRECVLSEIMICIGCIAGFIRGMASFYHIYAVSWVYYLVQIVTTLIAVVMLISAIRVRKSHDKWQAEQDVLEAKEQEERLAQERDRIEQTKRGAQVWAEKMKKYAEEAEKAENDGEDEETCEGEETGEGNGDEAERDSEERDSEESDGEEGDAE